MHIAVRTWKKNQNAVSVDYGPLTFSLEIGERWTAYGTDKNWPEFEVFPTNAWNYGLVLKRESRQIVQDRAEDRHRCRRSRSRPRTRPSNFRPGPDGFPRGNRIDRAGGQAAAQPGQITRPIETVSLIPMGAARLRITSFPVIGEGPGAHEWSSPKPMRVQQIIFWERPGGSHGQRPRTKNSSDHSIPQLRSDNSGGILEWKTAPY